MDNSTLTAEIAELMTMHNTIQSEVFQKYLARPMKAERDKLRTAFFSDSLKESWRKGGKQEGITLFMKLVENIHSDLNNKIEEQRIDDSQRA